MKNIIYVKSIYEIGGIETFVYELCKKFYKMNLEVVYDYIHPKQLERLKKYAKCTKYNGEYIECNAAIFNYDLDIIDNVKANRYIQIIHFDYLHESLMGWYPPVSEKIQEYYAVSKRSAINYTKLTGKPCGYKYLPISIREEPKIMHLISAQRFGMAKGDNRVMEMIKKLDASSIPYIWYIFSNKKLPINSKNVIYMKPTMNIKRYIKDADYTVALSDNESWGYTIYESLCLGVPVITTKMPVVIDEMKINENNGFLLDFDLSNLNIQEIYNRIGTFNFKYKPIKSDWEELFKC